MAKIVVTQLPQMRQRCQIGQQVVLCDQPKSWGGLEENGSPTDLFAAALGACMLTMMAFEARKHGVTLDKATLEIEKELNMGTPKRITKIKILVQVPLQVDDNVRKALEEAATHCPIHNSLSDDTVVETQFQWI